MAQTQAPSIHSLVALERLGIDPSDVGTVMLDVEDDNVASVLDEDMLYTSTDPKQWWVKGREGTPHVTLLHGLLPQVDQEAVDEVLAGWELPVLIMNQLTVFPGPLEQPYNCIVSTRTPEHSSELLAAHARLSMLPHVNFYPEYTPHVTIAYVHKTATEDALARLRKYRVLRPVGVRFSPAGVQLP